MEHDISYNQRHAPPPQYTSNSNSPDRQANQRAVADASTPNPNTSKPPRQENSDNLKSFKVSLDDPTWKVLPAALKKYRINNDNWQNYAMFICYGATGRSIIR